MQEAYTNVSMTCRSRQIKDKKILRLVVQEVVSQIVAYVSEDTTTVDCCRSIPAVAEYSLYQVPERCCQDDEKGGRHHKSVSIHGQVVVYAV